MDVEIQTSERSKLTYLGYPDRSELIVSVGYDDINLSEFEEILKKFITISNKFREEFFNSSFKISFYPVLIELDLSNKDKIMKMSLVSEQDDDVEIDFNTMKIISLKYYYLDKKELIDYLRNMMKISKEVDENLYREFKEYYEFVSKNIDKLGYRVIYDYERGIMCYQNFTIVFKDIRDVINVYDELTSINWGTKSIIPTFNTNKELIGFFDGVDFCEFNYLYYMINKLSDDEISNIISELENVCSINNIYCNQKEIQTIIKNIKKTKDNFEKIRMVIRQ